MVENMLLSNKDEISTATVTTIEEGEGGTKGNRLRWRREERSVQSVNPELQLKKAL